MFHINHFHSRAALQAGKKRERLEPSEKYSFFRNPGVLDRKEVFFLFFQKANNAFGSFV